MTLRMSEEEYAELMRRRGRPHPSAPRALTPSPKGKALGRRERGGV